MAWLTNRVASEIIRASHINTLISNIQQWAGNVSAFGNRLLNLGSPVDGTDAANKTYVDTQVATKADAIHNHDIASVTNLQSVLDGKSNTGHGHAIADVSGLWTALDLKAIGVASSTANRVPVFANTGGKQLGQSLTEIQSDGSVNVPSGASFKIDGVPLSVGGSPSFASITGDPMDNANLAIELDNRANLFHQHSFADITGNPDMTQLGTGTPSASNFLRGDGSWQAVSGGGATDPLPVLGNLDATTNANGTYYFGDSTTGTKPGFNYGSVIINRETTSDGITQLATSIASNAMAFRRYQSSAGGWQAWQTVTTGSHTHAASDVTSGVFHHNRLADGFLTGGLNRVLMHNGSTTEWRLNSVLPVVIVTNADYRTTNFTATKGWAYSIYTNNIQITLPTNPLVGDGFFISIKSGVTGTLLKRQLYYEFQKINWVAEDLQMDVPGTYWVMYTGGFGDQAGFIVV